jgi:predicted RNA binding protein YcfA (HicA-like mRNA interferase family)
MRKLGKIKINIKEPTPTAAERLQQSQQAIRKAKGLPDPSHYKQMAAQKKAEIDAMKEEKQTELKPRNFVAKNAKTVGAGKHKDIRKILKDVRGQKHKGKMEEEVEQLDELSKSTLGSYVKKASSSSHENSASNLASRAAYKLAKSDDSDAGEKDDRKSFMRSKSIGKAVDRLTKEEAEQLDELSKSTLGNYTSSAAVDLAKRSLSVGQKSGKSNYSDNPEHRKYDITKDPEKDKMVKRVSGITKASMRLAKEEVEQLDEMPESSMKTRDVHAHLKSKGWAVARTSGGHDIYKHPKAKNIIAVPRHKQLKAPLIKGILKSSQVSEEVVDEAIRIGGIGSGKSSRRSYGTSHGMGSAEGDTLENIPFHPKTDRDKRIKAALSDFGDKMKEKYPNLKEGLGGALTVFKKGTNIKQKINPNSYATFKQHGFRKVAEAKDSQEYDYEGDMAKSDLRSIMHHAKELHDMIDDNTNLAEWCQSKITLAEDYLSTVANYMRSEMNEDTLEEGRASQRHPLEGHEYHKKSNEALVHIAKDAHKAAEAMKGHNTDAENKYRDQANDSATVRHFRQKNGMPDWYKKKYGHVNEEVMSEDENDYRRKIEKNNKRFVAATKRQQNPLTNVHTAKEIEKKMQQKPVKESASEPTEGEMKGKQQGMSRRAQIVKSAAKGKKIDNLDTFQKDPELSSEIHKT